MNDNQLAKKTMRNLYEIRKENDKDFIDIYLN